MEQWMGFPQPPTSWEEAATRPLNGPTLLIRREASRQRPEEISYSLCFSSFFDCNLSAWVLSYGNIQIISTFKICISFPKLTAGAWQLR